MPVTVKVKDVMDTKVHALDEGATVEEAIRMMIQKNVCSLDVERNKVPQGVVTERDVIRRCLGKGLVASKTQVGSISSSPIITIGSEAGVREAMDKMAAKDIRRLFVVENGKIIGRVTQTELFQSTLSVMEILSSLSTTL